MPPTVTSFNDYYDAIGIIVPNVNSWPASGRRIVPVPPRPLSLSLTLRINRREIKCLQSRIRKLDLGFSVSNRLRLSTELVYPGLGNGLIACVDPPTYLL